MTSIGFKLSSGDSQVDINAMIAEPDFENDDLRFTDINRVKRRRIYAQYKVWNIVFGLLSETEMDYLNELKVQEAPQMILDSITYNIDVISAQIRFKGAKMIVSKVDPE